LSDTAVDIPPKVEQPSVIATKINEGNFSCMDLA
jgi:hypothetical protein